MKIEMHLHTSETSPCAAVRAQEAVEAYADAGYDAIVVTDHLRADILRRYSGTAREKIEQYLNGYQNACRAAETAGIKVFFGIEVTLTSSGYNDFLIYGAEPDFLYEYPKLHRKTQKELYRLCCTHDLLLFQAHPFRSYCTPQDPRYLHGAEVFNGNPYYGGRENDLAANWAKKHDLLKSSGSDFHALHGIARGGIITDHYIGSSAELKESLKASIELIRNK